MYENNFESTPYLHYMHNFTRKYLENKKKDNNINIMKDF